MLENQLKNLLFSLSRRKTIDTLLVGVLFEGNLILLQSSLWKYLSSVHTDLLAIALALAMQTWVENFAKEWVEYPFSAMPANANSITNTQCEWTLTLSFRHLC